MIRIQPLDNSTKTMSNTYMWANSPSVMEGILKERTNTWEENVEWFRAAIEDSDNLHYMIMDEDFHVGNISMRNIDVVRGTGEMMIYIGNELSRGRGVGYKAIKEFLKACLCGFVKTVYVTVAEDNVVARHLYHKCGFVEEKTFKDAFIRDGKPINVIKMVRNNED